MDLIRVRLGGPVIIPHMTVAGGIWTQADTFNKVVERALESFAYDQARVTHTVIGTSVFQSLYLAAEVGDPTRALRTAVYAAFPTPEPAYVPHLSLYYGSASKGEKQAAVALADIPTTIFSIDSFAIAVNYEEKMRWKIVRQFTKDTMPSTIRN